VAWVTSTATAIVGPSRLAAMSAPPPWNPISSCVVATEQPSRRAPRDDSSSSPPASAGRVDPHDANRLRQVMLPLLQAMDHPCRTDQVRIGIINQNEINAANAGSCEFYVTMGLLRRANDDQLRGVLAHEIAHQDLGHVAKAQVLGAGLNIGAAVLQQLFPAAGVLAPIAGEHGRVSKSCQVRLPHQIRSAFTSDASRLPSPA